MKGRKNTKWTKLQRTLFLNRIILWHNSRCHKNQLDNVSRVKYRIECVPLVTSDNNFVLVVSVCDCIESRKIIFWSQWKCDVLEVRKVRYTKIVIRLGKKNSVFCLRPWKTGISYFRLISDSWLFGFNL